MTINTDILKNTAGLVMWLDGEINSRAGVRDTSINGMQNLVHTPYAGKSDTTGFKETLNGTATFNDDKSICIGAISYYPGYAVDDMTISWCIKFNPLTSTQTTKRHSIHGVGVGANGGFWHCLDLHKSGTNIHFAGYDSSQTRSTYIQVPYTKLVDNKLYLTLTSKVTQENSTKFWVNGEPWEVLGGDVPSSPLRAARNATFGGGSGNAMSFTFANNRIYFYKLWNRQLSEKEILDNYKRDLERFGE